MGREVERSIELTDTVAPVRPYQWDGINFLLNSEAALLADQMGLGKTVQTVLAARIALQKGDLRRVLVVAPYSLTLNWEQEARKWASEIAVQRVRGDSGDRLAFYKLPIPILIASYDQVRCDAPEMTSDVSFDLVILDEAQRIKNTDSLTTLACRLLPRNRAWALTGTPIENSVRDLISVFNFLKPGLIRLGMTRSEIHGKMQPYFLRRTKAEVLPELPEIIRQDMELELSGAQADAYADLWESRMELVQEQDSVVTEIHLLALITKLKQLCNFDEHSGESVKLDALKTILESSTGSADKVIVFSQYVATLRWLADQLPDANYGILHGGLTAEERNLVIENFQTKPGPQVLLGSLRAAGVGLNLQAASAVVLFDRWWNPAVENQAIERAHRFGRERILQVYRFIIHNTIEDRIESILREKQEIFDDFIEGADNAIVSRFTRAELSSILDLGRPI